GSIDITLGANCVVMFQGILRLGKIELHACPTRRDVAAQPISGGALFTLQPFKARIYRSRPRVKLVDLVLDLVELRGIWRWLRLCIVRRRRWHLLWRGI